MGNVEETIDTRCVIVWDKEKSYLLNLYNDRNVPLKEGYDTICYFSDGMFFVREKLRENFIDYKGELLYKGKWFYAIDGSSFNHGLCPVALEENDHNYIALDGSMLYKGDNKLLKAYPFCDSSNIVSARVYVENKGWNWLDTNGNFVMDGQWFDFCSDFNDYYYAVVSKDNHEFFIDTSGNTLFKDDNLKIGSNFVNDFAVVANQDGKQNYATLSDKNYLLYEWVDKCYHFNNKGFGVVKKDNKYNLVDSEGMYMFDTWFKEVSAVYETDQNAENHN